jgi:DNA-binding NtrC family response regulator
MARVLVAEKHRPIRRLIAGILSDFGHEVRECAECSEARRSLKQSPVDVLVSDLVLDGAPGDRLWRDCAALGVRAVTLTGWEYRPDRVYPDWPPPLAEKPFRVTDLQGVVHAVGMPSRAA